MARVTEDEFAGKDIAPVYLAETLKEAKTVEEILNGNGIDYLVEIEQYAKMSILTSPVGTGVAFYVLAGQAAFCRSLLESKGASAGIVDD